MRNIRIKKIKVIKSLLHFRMKSKLRINSLRQGVTAIARKKLKRELKTGLIQKLMKKLILRLTIKNKFRVKINTNKN
jgi:hypothetical protein